MHARVIRIVQQTGNCYDVPLMNAQGIQGEVNLPQNKHFVNFFVNLSSRGIFYYYYKLIP